MSNKIKALIALLLLVCIGIGIFVFADFGKKEDDILTNDLFTAEYMKVGTQGKFGLIDKNGKEVMPLKFEDVVAYENSEMFAIKQDGKWGYADISGNIVIKPQYDQVGNFGESALAPVKSGEKWGYINRKGEKIVDFLYIKATDFDKHKMAVVEGDERPFYINEKGEKTLDVTYDMLGNFNENGYAPVSTKEKYGIIDTNGNVVIEPAYDRELFIDNDNFAVVSQGDKYGIINAKGEVIAPVEYDFIIPTVTVYSADDMSSGISKAYFMIMLNEYFKKYDVFDQNDIVIAVKDGKAGLINSKGEEVITPQFKQIQVYTDGNAVLGNNGEMYSFYDLKGNVLMNGAKYEKANGFNDGFGVVSANSKWGYVDTKGNFIVQPQYDAAWAFTDNGLAVVKKGEKYGFIDRNGELVIDAIYNGANTFVGDVTKVFDDSGWKLLKTNGDVILGNIVAEPKIFDDGYIVVETNDGKYVLYDLDGNVIVKTNYDTIGNSFKSRFVCHYTDCYNPVVPETEVCEEHTVSFEQ